jgi:hypothetical protein
VTLVYRGGKMVEKSFAAAFDGPSVRSDLPCPNIIRDGLLEPLQHQVTGRFYESKRAMAAADKEAGCVCVGNEKMESKPWAPPPISNDEIDRAYQKVSQGYKPAPLPDNDGAGNESGWS